MNREQIMKALEFCGVGVELRNCTSSCPYYNIPLEDTEDCCDVLARDAHTLIKSLSEENEKLKSQRYLKYNLHSVIDLPAVLSNTRKDAINDFIDELLQKAHQEYLLDGVENYYCLTYQQIEQVYKKLTEEE